MDQWIGYGSITVRSKAANPHSHPHLGEEQEQPKQQRWARWGGSGSSWRRSRSSRPPASSPASVTLFPLPQSRLQHESLIHCSVALCVCISSLLYYNLASRMQVALLLFCHLNLFRVRCFRMFLSLLCVCGILDY